MWVIVNPHEPETFTQIRAMLEDERVLGINIHPAEHEYDLAQYGRQHFFLCRVSMRVGFGTQQ